MDPLHYGLAECERARVPVADRHAVFRGRRDLVTPSSAREGNDSIAQQPAPNNVPLNFLLPYEVPVYKRVHTVTLSFPLPTTSQLGPQKLKLQLSFGGERTIFQVPTVIR